MWAYILMAGWESTVPFLRDIINILCLLRNRILIHCVCQSSGLVRGNFAYEPFMNVTEYLKYL